MKKALLAALLAAMTLTVLLLSSCANETPSPASSDVAPSSDAASDASENEGQYLPDWN